MSNVGVRTPEQAASDVTVFKALANPVRLRIVSLVAAAPEGQVSAGQIVEAFDLSQPTISHHLRLLREAGVLTTYKTSTFVFYRFAPTLIQTVSAVLPDKAAAAPPPDVVHPQRHAAAPGSQLSDALPKRSAKKSGKKTDHKPEKSSDKAAKKAKSKKKKAKKSGK